MDINYDRCNVSSRLKTEIIKSQGEAFWQALIDDIVAPSDDMDWKQSSASMRIFLEKFQGVLPQEKIKAIIVNVRHDLQRDDFDWAVRLFNKIRNIDRFAIELQQIGIRATELRYGDQSTSDRRSPEAINFVKSIDNIFYGRRYGNEILAQAIPADVVGYLNAQTDQQRRYSLCHCQFARESILDDSGAVSPVLCDCSLGHTMMLWEIVLDQKLSGEVLESALKGSNRCLFKIALPDEVVHRWT